MMDFLTEFWWRAPISAATALLSALVAFYFTGWPTQRAEQQLWNRLLADAAK